MIEFAIVVIGALIIIGVTIELFQRLARYEEQRYEARSRTRLLEELRRQR